jgi:predicted branched-subunit amino acid permease
MRRFKIDRVIFAFSVAVFVFGVTFGVLSRAAGLSSFEATSMSALVFAGASQFAVVGALAAGGSAWIALVAGGLLNLRLFALALSVAPSLSHSGPVRALQSYLVTDESVAISAGPDGSVEVDRFVSAGLWIGTGWIVGTAIGAVGGSVIGDPLVWGLDAAFPGGFLALLGPRLFTDPVARRVAIAGAAVGLALTPFVPLGVAPLIAALTALLAYKA